MPADDGVRLHDNQRAAPVSPTSRESHPKQSVVCPEAASRRSVERRQLLPQRQVFQDQFPMAAERQRECADGHDDQFQHAVDPGWSRREIQLGRVLAMVRLTPEQGRRLLECATQSTPRELRDHAMVAMLIGCGLRRAELLALRLESIQQREEHWVIADLVGKAGHVRTVPIPTWVKAAVDAWTTAAAITNGSVFRAINKAGRIWGDGMSPKVLWDVVRAAAARASIEKLAPHDLRRTCARLCHLAGGELDQIQFLLGHVSIQTTERYLDANRSSESPSTTGWESNLMRLDQQSRQGGCSIRPATSSTVLSAGNDGGFVQRTERDQIPVNPSKAVLPRASR